MGCTSSRSDISYEEAALINGDSRLYYFNHDISTLYKEFKNESKGRKISLSTFESLAKSIPLVYEGEEDIISFYQNLSKRSKLQLKHLVALAAILSKGTIPSKIDSLIQTWGSNDSISRTQFSELLDFIFELSVDRLTLLKSKPTAENNYTDESMENFLERAKEGKERSKEKILNEIFFEETVKKTVVTIWALNENNQNWFNSRYIRSNLKKAGKKVLRRKRTQPSRTEEVTLNE